MIRRLARLALAGAAAAWATDRWLAGRRGGAPIAPLEMLEVVDAPVDRVWPVLSDIPGQPVWMHEMKSVRLLTDGPTRVGTRGEATVRVFGIPVRDPVEVVAFEPPRRFAIRHEGLYTGGGVITLEPGADGTTTIIRWSETLVAPMLPDLAAAVQEIVLRPIFQADLHRLKALVETGSTGSAG